MKNKSYVIGSLIIVIVSGLFLFFGRGPSFVESKKLVTLQEQTEDPLIKEEELKRSYPRGAIRIPSTSLSTISSGDLKTFRNSYPDQQEVKADVAKDPHKAPDSLINFAKTMGPLMEKAFKSGEDAKVLINELHDCALNDSVAQTARALCVLNADKLAKNYPKMKSKASEIRANVSPEVEILLNRKNLMMKK